MSQIGGGQKKNKNVSNSNLDIWNPMGGVSIFQKSLNYKLLSDPILKKEKSKHLIFPFLM